MNLGCTLCGAKRRVLRVDTDPAGDVRGLLCRKCLEVVEALGPNPRRQLIGMAHYMLDAAARGLASDNEIATAMHILEELGDDLDGA